MAFYDYFFLQPGVGITDQLRHKFGLDEDKQNSASDDNNFCNSRFCSSSGKVNAPEPGPATVTALGKLRSISHSSVLASLAPCCCACKYDTHDNVLNKISKIVFLRSILLAIMQFPLPEASIMLWFVQRNQRTRAWLVTITQKPCNDKHSKGQ